MNSVSVSGSEHFQSMGYTYFVLCLIAPCVDTDEAPELLLILTCGSHCTIFLANLLFCALPEKEAK